MPGTPLRCNECGRENQCLNEDMKCMDCCIIPCICCGIYVSVEEKLCSECIQIWPFICENCGDFVPVVLNEETQFFHEQPCPSCDHLCNFRVYG